MAQPQEEAYPDSFVDFSTRITDIESRQKLLKDRIILIGENLVETKEIITSEIINLKKDVSDIKNDIEKIKSYIERLGEDRQNFARKSQVEVLEKQSKMFQPLNLATKEYVDDLFSKVNSKKGLALSEV